MRTTKTRKSQEEFPAPPWLISTFLPPVFIETSRQSELKEDTLYSPP